MKRRLFGLFAALLLLSLMPGSALGAATLDQSNTGTPTLTCLPTFSWAQSVTAGLAGTLAQVDLYMQDGKVGGGPVTVKIEGIERSAGYPPNNNVLATGTTTVAMEGWYSFALSPAISLLAGGHFAIVVAFASTQSLYATGDHYPGGQVWLGSGSSWGPPGTNEDLDFRTWMNPTPTPTPTPTPPPAPTPTPAAAPTAAASLTTAAPAESATEATLEPSTGATLGSERPSSPGETMARSATASPGPGSGTGSTSGPDWMLPLALGAIALLAVAFGVGYILIRRKRRKS
jgi:hypothetical protein